MAAVVITLSKMSFRWLGLISLAFGFTCDLKAADVAIRTELIRSSNSTYFQDKNGNVVFLAGSHTWNTLQDWGLGGSTRPTDFTAFVRMLTVHKNNFTLLWTTELPNTCNLPSTATSPPPVWTVSPFPWRRTGPGKASDGKPKFDLTRYDDEYFSRLRNRVNMLRKAGIYAGVYLFTGEWLNVFRCAEDGYPFTGGNNINGVDDGYRTGPRGLTSMNMHSTNAITKVQDAYVEKVIDVLNDMPNVLWVVSEEAPVSTLWWNKHQIAHIKSYERKKAHQHPVGLGALIDGPDRLIYDSDADWVAPATRFSPTSTCGAGQPRCKVNVNDSDHSYFGMWSESAQTNRNYIWKNFTSGAQVLFMDPYITYYPRENRNLCASPLGGECVAPDKRYDNFRDNLGFIVTYSHKFDLAKTVPCGSLASTGYCLAEIGGRNARYLVYAPSGGPFTVDTSALPRTRRLTGEWFNPSTGAVVLLDPIPAGSSSYRFTPPFRGDAVLYLAGADEH